MLELTIAIPARNEERNLSVCLQAIDTDFAQRVVVIDSASSDGTAAHDMGGIVTVVNGRCKPTQFSP